MVLYCTQHPSAILRAIVHKLKYHPHDEAVIITECDISSPHCPHIDDIKYYQFNHILTIVSGNDKETIIENTQNYIGSFLENNKIKLSDFSAIYAMNDLYNPFTLFFELNSIEYMYIEILPYQFSFFSQNLENWSKESEVYASMISELHLQDAQSNNCIKGYLYSNDSTYSSECKTPMEIFGYYDNLLQLDYEKKCKLTFAYDSDKYRFDTLILTNSMGYIADQLKKQNISIPSNYGYPSKGGATIYFIKVVLDYYFFNIDFSLKLHPTFSQYAINAFNEYNLIPNHIPAELFAITERNFNVICIAHSTSTEFFKKSGYNTQELGLGMFTMFKYIHFIYLSFTLIQSIRQPQKITIYGIDTVQLDHFKNWAYKNFKSVVFEKLTKDNVKSANYIIAEPNAEFIEIIKDASDDCLIIVNGDYQSEPVFAKQDMLYSIIDISNINQVELQKFSWTVLSKNESSLQSSKNFCVSYTLENAKVRIQSTPFFKSAECEMFRFRESNLLLYGKYMQMYYEVERTGYSFYDYLKERDLLNPTTKLAFFAADEFGVMIYRVCQRLGIEFSILVSNIDREITYKTHENFTETLWLKSMDNVDKSMYTKVFMATSWNKEYVDYVKHFCPNLFLFDAVVLAMYTRAFLLNKITLIKERSPGIKTGIFFTPFIARIPGEHSELENFFSQQGRKMQNILHNIHDNILQEKAKELCYRKHGFSDEYIEDVLNANFQIVSHDGVYEFQDYASKYVNIVNHRRVTANNPKDFTNTVYFFGDSCVTGFHVGDSETIESYFQNILNDQGLPYQVQNCSNTWEGHFDWIFTLTDTMQFKPGDILLFCSHVDWETEQYIKQNNKKLLSNILGIHTASALKRPHDFGEIFVNDHHCNGKGNSLIAQKIFDDLKAADFFNKDKMPDDLINESPQSPIVEETQKDSQLEEYLRDISQSRHT